jgi:hypothetical protein
MASGRSSCSGQGYDCHSSRHQLHHRPREPALHTRLLFELRFKGIAQRHQRISFHFFQPDPASKISIAIMIPIKNRSQINRTLI